MKYLKMLTRYKLKPDDYLKVQIAHSLKNMIDLDKVIEKEWTITHRNEHEACHQAGREGVFHNEIDQFII
jgi:hypothetical protein